MSKGFCESIICFNRRLRSSFSLRTGDLPSPLSSSPSSSESLCPPRPPLPLPLPLPAAAGGFLSATAVFAGSGLAVAAVGSAAALRGVGAAATDETVRFGGSSCVGVGLLRSAGVGGADPVVEGGVGVGVGAGAAAAACAAAALRAASSRAFFLRRSASSSESKSFAHHNRSDHIIISSYPVSNRLVQSVRAAPSVSAHTFV